MAKLSRCLEKKTPSRSSLGGTRMIWHGPDVFNGFPLMLPGEIEVMEVQGKSNHYVVLYVERNPPDI